MSYALLICFHKMKENHNSFSEIRKNCSGRKKEESDRSSEIRKVRELYIFIVTVYAVIY